MPTLLERIFGRTSAAQADTPLSEARFVVFDTELTGLDQKKDSIVSIGALKMEGSRIEVGRPFYRIVEPSTELTGKSIVIHGITPSETEGRPDMKAILPEFLEFCGDAVLVGHHVMMDMVFVNNEMKEVYGHGLRNPSVDTIRFYRNLSCRNGDKCAFYENESEDVNLFTLAREFEIDVSGAHNALQDAYVTAQLFQRLLSMFRGKGGRTLKDLLKVASP